MQPEHSGPRQIRLAWVERLAGALFDLAGDQDVRVIEALAAVLARQCARQCREKLGTPLRGCPKRPPRSRLRTRHPIRRSSSGAPSANESPGGRCTAAWSTRRAVPRPSIASTTARPGRAICCLSACSDRFCSIARRRRVAGGRLANLAQPEPAADRRSRPIGGLFRGSGSPLGLQRVRIDAPSRQWRLFSAFR